jgi:multidrug transporter EmrE-like cation transporter
MVTTKRSVVLIVLCTFIGAAAQVLMKIGGAQIHGFHLQSLLTNFPLITGYAFYALNTLLLILALREGELSKLYPIIALTFVWVNILSMIIFHEQINVWKIAGIVVIMSGVTFLGMASKPSSH